ncbi:MAG: cadherin-like beta sandwich domain-containing protein [Clostridia bacterium]|nr:cadherin-like beta sandwich domain-containing protein [Clostridia bacterium]
MSKKLNTIKKSLLAIFIAAVTFVSVAFFGMAFQTSGSNKSASAIDVMSDVKIETDTDELVPGGTVTLTITLSSKRKDLAWSSIDLFIGPVTADGKYDKTAAKDFCVDYTLDKKGNRVHKMVWSDNVDPEEYDTSTTHDELETSGYFKLGLSLNSMGAGGEWLVASGDEIVITVPIRVSSTFSGSNVTFGITNSGDNQIMFTDEAGYEPTDSASGYEDGLLSCTPVKFGGREANTVGELASLGASDGLVSKSYSGDDLKTTMTFTSGSENLNNVFVLHPKWTDGSTGAKIEINGTEVTNDTDATFSLSNTGETTFNIIVTAEDKTTKKTYTLVVTSSYVRLDDVEVSVTSPTTGVTYIGYQKGDTTTSFDKDTFTYKIYVPSDSSSIKLTPTVLSGYGASTSVGITPTGCTTSPSTTVSSGSAVTITISGLSSSPKPSASVKFTATAKDGTTTQVYTFDFEVKSVSTAITGLTMTGNTDKKTYNSESGPNDYNFNLGSACKYQGKFNITLADGATAQLKKGTGSYGAVPTTDNQTEGSYFVKVTAEAGNTKEYSVLVNKVTTKASFSALTIKYTASGTATDVLTDTHYTTATKKYAVEYAPSTYAPGTEVYITATKDPTDATVTPGGGLTTSGGSGYKGTLAIGTNTFTLAVSSDGGGETYTFEIKLLEKKNTIENIAFTNSADATPAYTFSKTTTSYDLKVPNSVKSVDFTVTTDATYAYVYNTSTSNRLSRSTTDGTIHTISSGTIGNDTNGGTATFVFYAKADNGAGADGTKYTIKITRAKKDTNNFLSSLVIKDDTGAVVPFKNKQSNGTDIIFDKETNQYYIYVKKNGRSSASFTIDATREATTSSVEGVKSDLTGMPVTFDLTGKTENTQDVTITCTSEAGVRNDYKIKICRKIDKGDFTKLEVSTDGSSWAEVKPGTSSDYTVSGTTISRTINISTATPTVTPGTSKFYVRVALSDEASVSDISKLSAESGSTNVYSGVMAFGSNTYSLAANANGKTTYTFNITLVENLKTITALTLTNGGTDISSSFSFSTGTDTYGSATDPIVVDSSISAVTIDATTDGSYAYVCKGSGSGTKFTRSATDTTKHSSNVDLTAGSVTTIKIHAVSNNAISGLASDGTEYTFYIKREKPDSNSELDSLYVEIDGVKTNFVDNDGNVVAFNSSKYDYTIKIECNDRASAQVELFAEAASDKATVTYPNPNPNDKVNTFNFTKNSQNSVTYHVRVTPETGSATTYNITVIHLIKKGEFTKFEFSKDNGSTWESLIDPVDQFNNATRTYTRTFVIGTDGLDVGDKIYIKVEYPSETQVKNLSNLTLSSDEYQGTLAFGTNKYSITASSTSGNTVYNLELKLLEQDNAIDNITLTSGGTALTGFSYDKATKTYNVTVPYATDTVDISVLTSGDYAVVKSPTDGTFTKATDGTNTHTKTGKALSVGANTITIYAVADKDTGAKGDDYTITITRTAADTNSQLTSLTLTIDGEPYDLKFDPDTLKYTVELEKPADKSSSALVITASTTATGATISGDGSPEGTDHTFTYTQKTGNSKTYTVSVTPEAGPASSYIITVTEKVISGDFEKLEFAPKAGMYSDVFTSSDYDKPTHTFTTTINLKDTDGVGSYVYIRANATGGATVTNTGLVAEPAEASWPYVFHGALAIGKNTYTLSASSDAGNMNYQFIIYLVEEKNSVIKIDITNDGNKISKDYAFDQDEHTYTFEVPNAIKSALFTVTVDGTYTVVESQSSGKFTVADAANKIHTHTVTLDEGKNVIKVRANSDNGDEWGKTGEWYTFNITRKEKDTEDHLKSLEITIGGKVVPFNEGDFDPERLNYTIQVDGAGASVNVNVNGVPESDLATVLGNGNYDFMLLDDRSNAHTYQIEVTAEAGNKRIYKVTISQEPIVLDSNYDVTSLVITGSDGKQYHTTVPASYNSPVEITVPYLVDKVTVVASVYAKGSTKYNGTGDGNYTIPEPDGVCNIRVWGVAEDNSNADGANAYVFNIKREPKSELLGLEELLVNGTLIADFDPDTKYYKVRLPSNGNSAVTLGATAQDSRAEVTINGGNKGTGSTNASIIVQEGEKKIVPVTVTIDGETTTYNVELVRASSKPRLSYLEVGDYDIFDENGNKINTKDANEVSKHDKFYIDVDDIDHATEMIARTDTEDAIIELLGNSSGTGSVTGTVDLKTLLASGSESRVQITVKPNVMGPDDESNWAVYSVYFRARSSSTDANIVIKGDVAGDNGVFGYKTLFEATTSSTAYLSKTVDYRTSTLDFFVELAGSGNAKPGTYEIVKKTEGDAKDEVMVEASSSKEVNKIPLSYGVNVFCVNITSSDERHFRTVVFVVERVVLAPDKLSAQEIEALANDYKPTVDDYAYNVKSGVSKLTLKVEINEDLLDYVIKGADNLKTGYNEVTIDIYEKANPNARASASAYDGVPALRTITLSIYRESTNIWSILGWLLLALALLELLIILLLPKRKKIVEKVIEAPAPDPVIIPQPVRSVQPIIIQQAPAQRPQVIMQPPQQAAPQPVYVQPQQVAPQQPVYVQPQAAPQQVPVQQVQQVPVQQAQQPVNVEVKIVSPDGNTINVTPDHKKK